MSPKTATIERQYLASLAIIDAYTDFILSRQAMNCTKATMSFYANTAGKFLEWAETQGLTNPQEITSRYVRQYLAILISLGRKDTTVHDHARAIRTLVRFWYNEGYITQPVRFDMPKLEKKRLLVLSPDELVNVIKQCNPRDKAIVMLMVDSGLRRSEVSALNWDDLDMNTGLIHVRLGKGKKDRSAVVGASTRRVLLAYKRTLPQKDGAMFRSRDGSRLSGDGLMLMFRRLSDRTGIHITAHSLRRSFAIMSLRNGMDVLHLQVLGGWSDLEMVQRYAQMVDEDLLQAHKKYSPIDNLK